MMHQQDCDKLAVLPGGRIGLWLVTIVRADHEISAKEEYSLNQL